MWLFVAFALRTTGYGLLCCCVVEFGYELTPLFSVRAVGFPWDWVGKPQFLVPWVQVWLVGFSWWRGAGWVGFAWLVLGDAEMRRGNDGPV